MMPLTAPPAQANLLALHRHDHGLWSACAFYRGREAPFDTAGVMSAYPSPA